MTDSAALAYLGGWNLMLGMSGYFIGRWFWKRTPSPRYPRLESVPLLMGLPLLATVPMWNRSVIQLACSSDIATLVAAILWTAGVGPGIWAWRTGFESAARNPEETHAFAVGRRFRSAGAFAGFLAGLAVYAVACAPQVKRWPISTSVIAFIGTVVGGTLIGYFFVQIYITRKVVPPSRATKTSGATTSPGTPAGKVITAAPMQAAEAMVIKMNSVRRGAVRIVSMLAVLSGASSLWKLV